MNMATIKFAIRDYLRDKLTGLVPPENIILTQTIGTMFNKPDTYFPRIEIPFFQQVKGENLNNVQRIVTVAFGITGYLRRTLDTVEDADILAVDTLSDEVEKAMLALALNKKYGEVQTLDGLAHTSPQYEVHTLMELEPKISSFLHNVGLEFIS